jgi:hypothetical protein
VDLVAQWEVIEHELPDDWHDARVALIVADAARLDRAAALLGPLQPGRSGTAIRFLAARRGAGPSPGAVRRALERLDDEKIQGRLRLLGAGATAQAAIEAATRGLAHAWDEEVATLPGDWSDLYAEIELTSSDNLDPAALALAPLNPARYDASPGFRFRCARSFGYGAAPEMVRRSLARLDERGIPGQLRILWCLSDTRPVGTQGPVWYVGGKAV